MSTATHDIELYAAGDATNMPVYSRSNIAAPTVTGAILAALANVDCSTVAVRNLTPQGDGVTVADVVIDSEHYTASVVTA